MTELLVGWFLASLLLAPFFGRAMRGRPMPEQTASAHERAA